LPARLRKERAAKEGEQKRLEAKKQRKIDHEFVTAAVKSGTKASAKAKAIAAGYLGFGPPGTQGIDDWGASTELPIAVEWKRKAPVVSGLFDAMQANPGFASFYPVGEFQLMEAMVPLPDNDAVSFESSAQREAMAMYNVFRSISSVNIVI
jgi:hypothetical protein